jgi:hypothetical protein
MVSVFTPPWLYTPSVVSGSQPFGCPSAPWTKSFLTRILDLCGFGGLSARYGRGLDVALIWTDEPTCDFLFRYVTSGCAVELRRSFSRACETVLWDLGTLGFWTFENVRRHPSCQHRFRSRRDQVFISNWKRHPTPDQVLHDQSFGFWLFLARLDSLRPMAGSVTPLFPFPAGKDPATKSRAPPKTSLLFFLGQLRAIPEEPMSPSRQTAGLRCLQPPTL